MSASSVRGAGVGARFHGVQDVRVLGRDQADLDQVQRADEAVADAEAAGARDGVAQRDRPAVLEQDERGDRVVGDLLEHVPTLAVAEYLDAAFGRDLRAGERARLEPLLAFDPEADERTDRAADLDRLVTREVAEVLDLELARRI